MTSKTTPVWVWLPGATAPALAASLAASPGAGRWTYAPEYLARHDPGAVAPDPVQLRLTRRANGIALPYPDGLPGVVRDARPSGYGADRLQAAAGRRLTDLELLDQGVPDSVGAIEVTEDIDRKLAWRPHHFSELQAALRLLEDEEPSSRAARRLHDDASTSAGGERPKMTVEADGSLWLAKMQDRADVPHLPAKEFVTMGLAADCAIDIPRIRLEAVGAHRVFLIARFDRAGDTGAPTRSLYASAHTILGLDPASTHGDPRRSYLALADKLRIWSADAADLPEQLRQLWRRMAFNGLVGNVDDHPRNHGFHFVDGGWRLCPAFDITPAMRSENMVSLALATGLDNSSTVDASRLLAACTHFGVDIDDAAGWLHRASAHVTQQWQARMRGAGVPEREISASAPAFGLAHALADDPSLIDSAHEAAIRVAGRRHRSGRQRFR